MTQSDDAKGRYRLAHTMIRVRDLDRTLAFYVGLLGMEVLRQTDYPDGRFTNTFIGYGPEATDVYEACGRLAAEGVKITRPPGPMKHGTRNIAFVVDPDGYKIELLEPL